MQADHIVDPTNGWDQMAVQGILVTLAVDSAGVPVVRVSCAPDTPLLFMFNNDIVLDQTPTPEKREEMETALEVERAKAPLVEQVQAAVKDRVAQGDTGDPIALALEELDRIKADPAILPVSAQEKG